MSLSPGQVRVRARLDGDRLHDISVRAERPRGLARALLARPPTEIPATARRLFALCGHAHAAAAAAALAAAGLAAGPDDPALPRRLAAERLGEHLRGLLIGWHAFVPPLPDEAAAARAALGALAAAEPEVAPLGAWLAALGLGADAVPPPGSWAARLLADAVAETSFPPLPADPLRPADDAAVLAALEAGGEAFAASPSLAGRVAETGAFCRAAATAPLPGLAGRMAARFAEIADALAVLAGRAAPPAVVGGRAGGLAYGVVESPRGRLVHAVRPAAAGPVDYLVLAPTEWNFAAAGPVARALAAARFADPARVGPALRRFVALVDPCVGLECALEGCDA